MMERTSDGRAAREAMRAGEQFRGRSRPAAPASRPRPAPPASTKSAWRVIKPVLVIVGISGVSVILLQIADGYLRDNTGSGFLPDFLRPASSGPSAPQYATSLPEAEEKPPAAQGVQLSAAQIRYCLAQGIRLQGASRVVNTASQAEATRFLNLSDDYEPRCGNYRFAPDMMHSVKEEVEARRAVLEYEGAALIRPGQYAPPEEKPPVAQGAQLSVTQVRYCLAQGIRIQGASKVVNTSSQVEATRFLSLSDDYEPRCGNYHSAPEVLQAVKAEVEARRELLERQGAALIRPAGQSVPAAQAAAPPAGAAEERPPVGQGALLSASQVRYCLAQGIRIQGASKAVNTASPQEAGRFVALANDHESRCGNYRPAPGVTSAVKDEVESRRAALEREGAAIVRPPR
jgi:hypothetical protein